MRLSILSQLTLSKINLTLGMHVIAYGILSLYHSFSNHHDYDKYHTKVVNHRYTHVSECYPNAN